MPTIFSARSLAEIALQNIGAFPVSENSADPVELRRALQRLELVVNDSIGKSSVKSAWLALTIPLLASVSRYRIADYCTEEGVQFIYDAFLQSYDDGAGTTRTLIDSHTERDFSQWDKSATGDPTAVYIDGTNDPYLNVYPAPDASLAAGTYGIRLHCQTYATKITPQGTGGVNINIRPAWYLFITNKLSYELGKGAIRRLDERELQRFQQDYMRGEADLIGFDGSQNDGLRTTTEAWGQ